MTYPHDDLDRREEASRLADFAPEPGSKEALQRLVDEHDWSEIW